MVNVLKYLIILSAAILAIDATAATINIPADYATIQAGIDASSDGDTVMVQSGTYVENINFNGHNIILGSLFLVTDDTSYISTTVIDGNQSGSVVVCRSGEDSTTVIAGFTIRGGYAAHGGGIFCDSVSIVIRDNIIRDNNAMGDEQSGGRGGGIYCYYSDYWIADVEIRHNIIIRNIAHNGPYQVGMGGGISCRWCDPRIIDNIVSENVCGGRGAMGAGIYCDDAEAVISENVINDNLADWGSGIYCNMNSYALITSNVIYRNIGGGITCQNNSQAQIINNTITENTIAYGIMCVGYSYPVIMNNIVWNNESLEIYVVGPGSLEITYNDIKGNWEGEGNINANPLFCDSSNGDYWLAENSPCLGAGYEGADIGALGIGCEATDIAEINILPNQITIFQNCPNPFNASTAIKYELPRQSQVTIEIYDILGRKVSTLIDRQQPAGYHQAIWRADDFSSGMYFYTLQAGVNVETKKMLLLR